MYAVMLEYHENFQDKGMKWLWMKINPYPAETETD